MWSEFSLECWRDSGGGSCAGVFEEAVNERVEFLHFLRLLGGEVGGFAEVFAAVVEFVCGRISEPAQQYEIAAAPPHASRFLCTAVGEVVEVFEP